jgi:hypothetical protein
VSSVFPSVTGPAYTPFLMGRFPGPVGLPGIRWYDRGRTHTRWPAFSRSYVGADLREVGRDLDLPGAERIRLPENATALFQILTANASAHGDVLFSEPGMFSFNLWSGLPTPTLTNVTHWFSLLNPGQQQAIIRVLEAHPRACVIIHREHLEFLTKRGLRPSGPLHDYIAANFKPAFTLDNFEFAVRRGRTAIPLQLATVYDRAENASAAGANFDTRLELTVLLAQLALTRHTLCL